MPYPFLAVSYPRILRVLRSKICGAHVEAAISSQATPKDAPGIYVGMCVVISIIYALVYGLVRLRDRYFTGSGVANTGYAPIA